MNKKTDQTEVVKIRLGSDDKVRLQEIADREVRTLAGHNKHFSRGFRMAEITAEYAKKAYSRSYGRLAEDLERSGFARQDVDGFMIYTRGDTSPSRADIEVTKRIKSAGEIIGIRMHDHVIVSETGYTSMAGEGHL